MTRRAAALLLALLLACGPACSGDDGRPIAAPRAAHLVAAPAAPPPAPSPVPDDRDRLPVRVTVTTRASRNQRREHHDAVHAVPDGHDRGVDTAGRVGATARVSWYARGCCTASGERFDPDGLTAAHRTLPFGTRVRVCHDGCVVVRINDRGPARWTGRELDLARGAFVRIAPLSAGVVSATWEVV